MSMTQDDHIMDQLRERYEEYLSDHLNEYELMNRIKYLITQDKTDPVIKEAFIEIIMDYDPAGFEDDNFRDYVRGI